MLHTHTHTSDHLHVPETLHATLTTTLPTPEISDSEAMVPDWVLLRPRKGPGQRMLLSSTRGKKRHADHFRPPLPPPYSRKRLNAEMSAMATVLMLATMAQARPTPA
jgi:hypothetical protein